MQRSAKLISLLLLSLSALASAVAEIQRVEPPFWWTKMPVKELQLQLYGEDIGHYRASVDHKGVSIVRQMAVDSTNYLFLYLEIGPETKAGTFDILLRNKDDETRVSYELKEREDLVGRNLGFDSTDAIYLMMPDRFANGDPDNDSIPGMLEKVDRSDPTKRQGGDLKGVLENVDYIKDLGMTAVWFTPIFENDMTPEYGAYHGYAATDLYKVDRRLGSNEEYKQLIDTLHSKGMKVIMDMIHNHIGINHWWMSDLPTSDWVHDFEKYGQTNFKGTIPPDPHASKADKDRLVKGWFVPEMPDLDQRNELLADYLIQNTIWWIEYSGVDGIRMDTYLYPYADYMARWADEVLTAYPNFNIVGEAWVESVAHEAFWQYDDPGVDDGYDSHLPSVTDFPVSFAVRSALLAPSGSGWDTGLKKLYYTLAQDGLYSDPNKNVIFLDNHDMGRIFETLDRDEKLFKMAYAFIMTCRGIPQIYYGTELMMGHEDRGGDDEVWRQTMPGGWEEDSRSVFEKSGRSKKENENYSHISKIANWRKTSEAVHRGSFLHFIPEDDVYVYFRTLPDEAVMVVMNANHGEVSLDTNRFSEVLNDYTSGVDVLTGKKIDTKMSIAVSGKTSLILELQL